MDSLVELISRIGIFMLAGQAVIHFAPGQKYAKYIKLIVGLMILIQFLSPINKLMGGMDIDWSEQLLNIEAKLNGGLYDDGSTQVNSLNASIIAGMEKEIKSKLNNEISGEGYSVIKVDMDINDLGNEDIVHNDYYNGSNNSYSNNNRSYENYKLNKIRIAVRLNDGYENHGNAYENRNGNTSEDIYENTDENTNNTVANNVVKVDKVSIQKITTDDEAAQSDKAGQISNQADAYDNRELSKRLQERFCNVLGIKEDYMEVSIYGAVE